MIVDGLWDAFNDVHMGDHGREHRPQGTTITREEQDEFAAGVAADARKRRRRPDASSDEIVPVEIPQQKGDPLMVDTDEHPRRGTTAEGLGKLKPAFDKDGHRDGGQRVRHQRRRRRAWS